jgi:hypothetical protein
VVNHVEAAELRVVAAAVLAVADDIELELIQTRRTPPPKTLCPSGYRTGPPACGLSRAKKRAGGGDHAKKKGQGGAEECKKLRVAIWHRRQEMPVARARVSQTGERSGFTTPALRAVGSLQSALSVGGCGR